MELNGWAIRAVFNGVARRDEIAGLHALREGEVELEERLLVFAVGEKGGLDHAVGDGGVVGGIVEFQVERFSLKADFNSFRSFALVFGQCRGQCARHQRQAGEQRQQFFHA